MKKSWEANFMAVLLDILLHLLPEFPEGEALVKRRLYAALDGSVIRRTKEVGNGISLRLFVSHHHVLYAFVTSIAPCLH